MLLSSQNCSVFSEKPTYAHNLLPHIFEAQKNNLGKNNREHPGAGRRTFVSSGQQQTYKTLETALKMTSNALFLRASREKSLASNENLGIWAFISSKKKTYIPSSGWAPERLVSTRVPIKRVERCLASEETSGILGSVGSQNTQKRTHKRFEN